MKWLWKFHEWYDRQTDWVRLPLLLVTLIPFFTATLWVSTIGEAAFVVAYIGVILGTRMWHVDVRGRGRRRREGG